MSKDEILSKEEMDVYFSLKKDIENNDYNDNQIQDKIIKLKEQKHIDIFCTGAKKFDLDEAKKITKMLTMQLEEKLMDEKPVVTPVEEEIIESEEEINEEETK